MGLNLNNHILSTPSKGITQKKMDRRSRFDMYIHGHMCLGHHDKISNTSGRGVFNCYLI